MKSKLILLITIGLLSGCASHTPSSPSFTETSTTGTAIHLPPPNPPNLTSPQNNAQENAAKMLSY